MAYALLVLNCPDLGVACLLKFEVEGAVELEKSVRFSQAATMVDDAMEPLIGAAVKFFCKKAAVRRGKCDMLKRKERLYLY